MSQFARGKQFGCIVVSFEAYCLKLFICAKCVELTSIPCGYYNYY